MFSENQQHSQKAMVMFTLKMDTQWKSLALLHQRVCLFYILQLPTAAAEY